MGQPKDHLLSDRYVLRQGSHAASIRCGSTKSLCLHHDGHLADLKIDDGVYAEKPIQ